MTFPNYTPERRREIAAALEIDEQYVYQIVKGIRPPSPALARRFHVVAPDAQLQDLRPADWQDIWPELAATEAVPAFITGELPVPRAELVEAIKAGLIKDPRQVTRRAVDRKS